ncbi:hypothetical protein NE237_030342 [Protea cynaroides]|uniref:Uncharacterized protein n=1 Tax=Protea cynaroides TaxID=273540 RepID=A0A9Q0JWW5_9MAGN|nr:hypothetical protein NE237_030342 [Protea cynaroides]
MATLSYYSGQSRQMNSSHRSVAMALALVSAIVVSPLYHVKQRKNEFHHVETRWWWWWNSSFLLPLVLAGLIISIRAASSSSSSSLRRGTAQASLDASFVLRIGRSSWGLAGVLVLLLLVLSWQDSVQGFLWK